jgi:hypothetical protein
MSTLDTICSRQDPEAGFCEYGNEHPRSFNDGQFLSPVEELSVFL